jgi:hypothetical protein
MKTARSLVFALLTGFALAALVFAVVRWAPFGEYPGSAFFDLAAQTIPILLVALAVEAQARRFDLEEAGKRIRIAAVIFLACGETAAVTVAAALYEPDSGTLASELLIVVTAVGLLGGFFAVIAVALRTPPPSSASELQRSPIPATGPMKTEPSNAAAGDSERARSRLLPLLASAIIGGMLWRIGSPRGL